MEKPKTIKGYITMMRKIETFTVSDLKGFDKLSQETKDNLGELLGSISNIVNEIKEFS
jgi:hypothetical protein